MRAGSTVDAGSRRHEPLDDRGRLGTRRCGLRAAGVHRRTGRAGPARRSTTNLADLSPRAKRASADSDGAFIEDFCNWTAAPRDGAVHPRVAGAPTIAAELIGSRLVRLYHDHVLVKEPGTTPAHAVAPGPAVLQRRRRAERQHVVPRRPGRSRGRRWSSSPASHRGPWYMPRTFLDGQAKWFPDGSARRAARLRRRSRALPGDRLGARAGRRGVLPHAHRSTAAGGVSGTESPARAVGAVPRRRHGARARDRGPPRRRSPASTTSWPTARRWTTRCSRCCGTGDTSVTRPRDPVTIGHPVLRERGRRGAGRRHRRRDDPGSDRRPDRHDARRPTAPGSPPTQIGERRADRRDRGDEQPALPVQAADPADGRRSTR